MFEVILGLAALGGILYYATRKEDTSPNGGDVAQPGAVPKGYVFDEKGNFQHIAGDTKELFAAANEYREESSEMSPTAGAIAVIAVKPGTSDMKSLKERLSEIEANNSTKDDPVAIIAAVKDIDAINAGKAPARMTFFATNLSRAPEFAKKGSEFAVISVAD